MGWRGSGGLGMGTRLVQAENGHQLCEVSNNPKYHVLARVQIDVAYLYSSV